MCTLQGSLRKCLQHAQLEVSHNGYTQTLVFFHLSILTIFLDLIVYWMPFYNEKHNIDQSQEPLEILDSKSTIVPYTVYNQ